MSTATEAPPIVQVTEDSPQEEVEGVRALFRFSTWVHLGPGAETCEGVKEQEGTNDCSNPLHFHAWCRLPNPLQHERIREKALAAKARRTRQLRDPGTDANVILEDELDQIAAGGDAAKGTLVDELLGRDYFKDTLEAWAEVRDIDADEPDDDGNVPKKYAHIDEDMKRYQELAALPEDERNTDEFAELERHIEGFNTATGEHLEAIQAPKREVLSGRDLNDLIDEIRGGRIASQSSKEFMEAYNKWEWATCTLRRPAPNGIIGEPAFESIEHLEAAAPEVIEAIGAAYDDLEQTKNTLALGNT